MKKLIIILLMSVITLTCTARNIDNRSIYNIDRFIEDCLIELNVPDSIKVVIVNPGSNKQYAKIAPCTIEYADLNTCIIIISNSVEYYTYIKILAHELVHVKQFANNEIIYNTVARYHKEYNKFLMYDIRFENEANEIGDLLINKFLKIML